MRGVWRKEANLTSNKNPTGTYLVFQIKKKSFACTARKKKNVIKVVRAAGTRVCFKANHFHYNKVLLSLKNVFVPLMFLNPENTQAISYIWPR